MNTPFLMFGLEGGIEHFGAETVKRAAGLTDEFQPLWATKYQKILLRGDSGDHISEQFESMYALLERDGRLAPRYLSSDKIEAGG